MSEPLPLGFGLLLDRHARPAGDGTLLLGGRPRRLLRLTPDGSARLRRVLAGGSVEDRVTGLLARRLVDGGLAHPLPPAPGDVPAGGVQVVVPAHDRVGDLARCLAALSGLDVVVVDDGSADAAAVAAAATRHGARLVRREVAGGPAVARQAGVDASGAALLLFVDSDAQVTADAVARLLAHFTDPAVGAVAPRVVPLDVGAGAPRSVLGRFAAVRSPLDMGPDPAGVGAGATVPYVPSTVLAIRREALAAVSGFDTGLRYGEDVDLVWRLGDAGWAVRYDPSVVVTHAEPQDWPGWLRRRARYGTAAARLASRHPERLAPVVLAPAPLAVVGLALARRGCIAALLHAAVVARLGRRLRARGVPLVQGVRPAVTAPAWTALAAGRWLTQLGWPALALLARRRPGVAATLVLAPPLLDWAQRRPALDPVRFAAAAVADDVAYGTGVWAGAVRARRGRALVPVVRSALFPDRQYDRPNLSS